MANATTEKKDAGLVQQAASAVHQAADSAATTVGGGMEKLAGTVRDNLPREGVVGTAANAVASTLESGGRYLQENSPADMWNGVTDVIRKNPLTAVLVGLGIGLLVARMMKR